MDNSREFYAGAVAALEEVKTASSLIRIQFIRSALLDWLHFRIRGYQKQLDASPPDPRDEALRLAEEALDAIRGEEIEPDEDGLIADTTCCYCDGASGDCEEDCPRSIADFALNAIRKARGDAYTEAASREAQ